jgi:hypothetical protein
MEKFNLILYADFIDKIIVKITFFQTFFGMKKLKKVHTEESESLTRLNTRY